MLDEFIEAKKDIDGESAFKLYDTYGFPFELTKEIAEENGLKVDEAGYKSAMQEQKDRAKAATAKISVTGDIKYAKVEEQVGSTEFVGYNENECGAKILATVEGDGYVDIVLDKTPFYAECGGQVGDSGYIENDNLKAEVLTTFKVNKLFVHRSKLLNGEITIGENVRAKIDLARREEIRLHHSSAHLLQAALTKVLGNEVKQAGSQVEENRMRFDFTFSRAMTPAEISKTEDIVNEWIAEGLDVTTQEMDIEQAKLTGAVALFGEKYEDVVRVVSVGDYSVEFCGGTHVKNTANLGLFRIRQEGSVAAGVRRIEALTGMGVLKYINGMSAVIMDVCSLLKIANPKAVVEGVQKAEQLIKEQQREINELNSKLAVAQIGQLFAGTTEENGVRVVTGRIDKANADILRTMCEKARDFAPKCVCVLATENDGKVTFAAACGKEALALGANAGKIIKAVAQKAGGNGGGKPDMAMAGAKQPEKISEALDSVKETVYAMLK